MFVKNLDNYPKELHGDFIETEMDGEKGFMHKTDTALVNSLKNAKSEREAFKLQLDDVNTKLSDFEASKKTEIETARAEALEAARSKGDVKAIEERYVQQMEDLEQRVRKEAYEEAKSDMAKERAIEKSNSIAEKIGMQLGIDNDDAEAIADLLKAKGRVKVDASTGKEVYYDEKGSALSLDQDGFINQIKTESKFKRLIKADLPTQGNGNANGSNGSGGSAVKKFNDYTGAELSEIRQRDPALYDRLKSNR